MIPADTADKITSWAASRYGSNAPSLVFDDASAPTTTSTSGGGMLSTTPAAGSATAAAPAQSTTSPAPTSAPASIGQSTTASWADATATPASASASTPPTSTSPTSAPTSAPSAPKPDYGSVLDGLYQSELGRSADAAGKAWWEQQMQNGISADQVKSAMDSSDEWRAAHPTPAPTPAPTTAPLGPATINTADLTHRVIDQPTQTVQGQIGQILSDNSPVMQQARAQAMRAAADRGMLNSTMAASGGENAVIGAATGIGTTDAGFYNHAADYNAAADNQAIMYNADQQNQWQRLQAQLASEAAARSQQMTIAQMQDATSRYQAETSSATSRYNTDTNYRAQSDAQKNQLVNNIIQNMDLSPDRKAAMLEQLGMGTSAHQNADGTVTPGTGLAGAAYVIDSVGADLRPTSNYGTTYDAATGNLVA